MAYNDMTAPLEIGHLSYTIAYRLDLLDACADSQAWVRWASRAAPPTALESVETLTEWLWGQCKDPAWLVWLAVRRGQLRAAVGALGAEINRHTDGVFNREEVKTWRDDMACELENRRGDSCWASSAHYMSALCEEICEALDSWEGKDTADSRHAMADRIRQYLTVPTL